MSKFIQIFAQVMCYAIFIVMIGYCSNSPSYQHLAPELATVKISLRHSGQLIGECRDRTVDELARLPANMRAPKICPRERSPLTLKLIINDVEMIDEVLPPRGLHGDGMASYYRRLSVPAGAIKIQVKLNDQILSQEFKYQASTTVSLEPSKVLVIDFDSQKKEFIFQRR